jgi:hypothetical protein
VFQGKPDRAGHPASPNPDTDWRDRLASRPRKRPLIWARAAAHRRDQLRQRVVELRLRHRHHRAWDGQRGHWSRCRIAVAGVGQMPLSTTALVNSSTKSGTPSVRSTICAAISSGRALPPVTPVISSTAAAAGDG